LINFPTITVFFSHEDYEILYSNVNWHLEDAPRAHDAEIVTNIMRMRRGMSSSDIFETAHVLVTRNGILPGAAKRLAIQSERLRRGTVGPVIYQRELATVVWLRGGLEEAASSQIPMRYLMSSCERVLQIRPDVIEKVRKHARLRSKELASQLDLLLTSDRSTEILMDRTLNVSAVITDANVEQLIQDMKESLISEKTIEHRLTLRSVNSKNRQTLAELRNNAEERIAHQATLAQSATDKSDELQNKILTIHREGQESLSLLISDINSSLSKRTNLINRCATYAGLIMEIISAVAAYLFPNAATITLVIALSTVFVSHVSGSLGKLLGYGSTSLEVANTKLKREASRRGLTSKLNRFDVKFQNNQFALEILNNQI
jgi:hypothetical protein